MDKKYIKFLARKHKLDFAPMYAMWLDMVNDLRYSLTSDEAWWGVYVEYLEKLERV